MSFALHQPASPWHKDAASNRLAAGIRSAMRWIEVHGSRSIRADKAEPDRSAIELFNQGVLLATLGEIQPALSAYGQVLQSHNLELVAKAAFNIAILHSQNPTASANAYRIAIETGHEDVAPKAAFNLARLLEQHGDLAGATQSMRHAIEFGNEDVSLNAALALEHLGRDAYAPITTKRASTGQRPTRYRQLRQRRTQTRTHAWRSTRECRSTIKRSRGHA